ncbi:MAG: hypothetical protein ACOCQ4_03625 [bacterium]
MPNENENNSISVIGIDPAPRKESTVFDGKNYKNLKLEELQKYLEKLKSTVNEKILICWDAPLMNEIKENSKELYYFRPIDIKLRNIIYKKGVKIKNAEGASVMSFASCPHWTITRYLLGLPRFSKYDCGNIPFNLITKNAEKSNISKSIVEVHPAVGIYAWLGKLEKYKPNKSNVVKEIWNKLKEKNNVFKDIDSPKNDDELDAAIAYALGILWIQSDVVKLEGSESGAMLIPNETFFKI